MLLLKLYSPKMVLPDSSYYVGFGKNRKMIQRKKISTDVTCQFCLPLVLIGYLDLSKYIKQVGQSEIQRTNSKFGCMHFCSIRVDQCEKGAGQFPTLGGRL